MVKRIFDIYYGDEFLFRGYSREIAEHFKCKVSMLNYYAVNNVLWKGMYTVKIFKEEGSDDVAKWDLMDGDKVVFTGTVKQIKRAYGLQSFCASQHHKMGWKIHRKYDVVPHLTKEEKEKIGDPLYDQTLRLLNLYHNAYLRKDGERVQRKLAENGILTNLVVASDRKGCVLWEV